MSNQPNPTAAPPESAKSMMLRAARNFGLVQRHHRRPDNGLVIQLYTLLGGTDPDHAFFNLVEQRMNIMVRKPESDLKADQVRKISEVVEQMCEKLSIKYEQPATV